MPHAVLVVVLMPNLKLLFNDGVDAVIFSVSCFQGHLTGVMKNLTDHLAFLIHRPRFFHKKVMVISTTGGVSANSTTKSLAGTIAGWGFNKSYELPIVALSWNAYVPTERDLRKAEKVASKFYQDVKSNRMHAPPVWVLIPFNLFQAMCRPTGDAYEFPTEDHNFWPRYAGMQYAPGVPLPHYKRLLGKFIYFIGKHIGKRMIITYKK